MFGGVQRLIPRGRAANDAYDFNRYSSAENRADLMYRFNQILGRPTIQMSAMQFEFLHDQMSASDREAFVEVCTGIIAAAAAGSYPKR